MSKEKLRNNSGKRVVNDDRKLPPMEYSKPMPPTKPPKSKEQTN